MVVSLSWSPGDLLNETYKIFLRNIAVHRHGYSDYRELGLKRLLCMLLDGNEARFKPGILQEL